MSANVTLSDGKFTGYADHKFQIWKSYIQNCSYMAHETMGWQNHMAAKVG